jgi:hypothetical protein
MIYTTRWLLLLLGWSDEGRVWGAVRVGKKFLQDLVIKSAGKRSI